MMHQQISRQKRHLGLRTSVTLPIWMPADEECQLISHTEARAIIVPNHYSGTFPSTWTRSYSYQGAVVVFAFSANPWLENFLFGESVGLLELARLWAADGHGPD